MKIRQSTRGDRQPVLLMFFFSFVKRFPICFTSLTLSRYQVWIWRLINNLIPGDLSLFIEQRFELIYEIIFFVIYFLEKSWKKETYKTLCLQKYVNVPQLPIIDIAIALYVVCKYLIALSLDSLFLLCILLFFPYILRFFYM